VCVSSEIQGHSVSLLIDSGCSHTFISATLLNSYLECLKCAVRSECT
jgi:hypothetical protein